MQKSKTFATEIQEKLELDAKVLDVEILAAEVLDEKTLTTVIVTAKAIESKKLVASELAIVQETATNTLATAGNPNDDVVAIVKLVLNSAGTDIRKLTEFLLTQAHVIVTTNSTALFNADELMTKSLTAKTIESELAIVQETATKVLAKSEKLNNDVVMMVKLAINTADIEIRNLTEVIAINAKYAIAEKMH